jgi:DNA-directed RNA polymerase specialized sigma24 family protein
MFFAPNLSESSSAHSVVDQHRMSIFSNCKKYPRYGMTPFVEAPFSRYRGLLRFVAARVLNGHDGVEEAVRNCLLAAACNPPELASEGAFRSWLLRTLIDEALEILHEKRNLSPTSPEQVLSEVR